MAEKVAFKALEALGKEIVARVDELLLSGEMPSKIAEWLQKDQGVLLHLQTASVKKNLERYRDITLAAKVKAGLKGEPEKKPTVSVKKKLLAIDEMTELMEVQKGRLNKLLVKEATLPAGILLTEATKQVQLTKEILMELGKLQLETGVMRRAPKTLTGSLLDPATGEVRAFQWTEQQEALYKQLEDVDFERIEDAPALSN